MAVLVTGNSNAVDKLFVFGVLDTFLLLNAQSFDSVVVSASSLVGEHVVLWSNLRKMKYQRMLDFDLTYIMSLHYIDYAVVFTNGAKLAYLPQLKSEGITAYLYGRDRGALFDVETKPVVMQA